MIFLEEFLALTNNLAFLQVFILRSIVGVDCIIVV